jgi:hypothetical protein
VRLVLLAEAEAELDDAAGWYDEQRLGLGNEFLGAVQDALVVIANRPDRGRNGLRASTWERWADSAESVLASSPIVSPASPCGARRRAMFR